MLKIATFPIFHGWADYRQTRSTVADVTLYMTDPANFLVCPDGASWFQRFPRNVSSDKASRNSKRERNISEFLSFFFFSNRSRYHFFRIPFREIDGRCSNVRTANISCRGKYLNVDSTRYMRALCVPPIVSNYTPIHIRVYYNENHPLVDGSKYLRIISWEYISCWVM